MAAILTNYPLSSGFQNRVVELIGSSPEIINISVLRQRSIREIYRKLRATRVTNLYIPLEDENSSVLLPLLTIFASVIPATHTYTVNHNLETKSVSRFQAFSSIVQLVIASISARVSVVKTRNEINSLFSSERIIVRKVDVVQGLYLNANLWFGIKAGGSVGHISGVVNGLLQRGCEVVFASAGGRLLVDKRVKLTTLHPPNSFGFPWELNYYRFSGSVVRQLKHLCMENQFDFIYQRLSIGNYAGVVLSRFLGIPLIIEYNGSEAWVAKNWGSPLREQELAEKIERVNLNHAHMLVTISEVLRDELLGMGVPEQRIVTYPNCIDPQMFDPAKYSRRDTDMLRSRYNIQQDAILVTFIGTFGQWHGAEILAQAIRYLVDQEPGWMADRKLHFLLVGDGLKMNDVKAVLGDQAQGSCVTLTGLVPQDEAPMFLAASDILSSPHVANKDGSRFFGSPTKLFEYMAMGKAIVASDLDQIGKVLEKSIRVNDFINKIEPPSVKEELAVLCQPGSFKEHAEAIRFLADNPTIRKQLGENVRREALDKYTWSHHVGAILDRCAELGIFDKKSSAIP